MASLQMLAYNFTFQQRYLPLLIGGVHPSGVPKEGHAALLIEALTWHGEGALDVFGATRAVAADLYANMASRTFDPGEEVLPSLKKMVEDHRGYGGAYGVFDGLYRRQDMTVQKNLEDFKSIVNEERCSISHLKKLDWDGTSD